MEKINLKIENIPALLIGDTSDSVYLFIHGKSGYKEEAVDFAKIVCKFGWQVLSIDLPEHGERKNGETKLLPWNVVSELTAVMEYLKSHWSRIALRANSIGAWFSMLCFGEEQFESAFFVSPVLDMELLIKNMMTWASVSEERLEQEREIHTDFGETLSWEYYMYAKQHPIVDWRTPTHILYAGHDNLTSRNTVDSFTEKFNAELTVMENGEHWFHTEEQVDFLSNWIKRIVTSQNTL